MSLLPIFLKLADRQCLLVGAGNVALEKVGSLLPTGIKLRIVAPEARAEIQALAAEGQLTWTQRCFEDSDLDGNFIVIAATDAPDVNAAVYHGCVARNIACNSVDDIPNCDFFFGSVVSRGRLQIAISTSGESPAVAQRLRREIDAQLPDDLGPWLEELGKLRREVLEIHPRGEERKQLLRQLAQRELCAAATCPARVMAHELPARNNALEAQPKQGSVTLVGAGPGDPDLLTIKAMRLIQAADVILHDDLVPAPILALTATHAEVLNVGKRCGRKIITQDEINQLMIAHAHAARTVVRLKSGDPLLFGRAAEEMTALTDAGIAFEIVPGVTAASAAAASIGASLTDRSCASNVIFSTGHHAQSHHDAPLPEIEDATRVVYMPGRDLSLLAQEWLHQGLPPDFPCAVVSQAAQPGQSVLFATLGELHKLAPAAAPSLLIAGWALRKDAAPASQIALNLAPDKQTSTVERYGLQPIR
jgi:uroporphyrin-III C-methyltransferase/precorrin-2 dehydrogenase/sirohydrochlorin ferrochelatase